MFSIQEYTKLTECSLIMFRVLMSSVSAAREAESRAVVPTAQELVPDLICRQIIDCIGNI